MVEGGMDWYECGGVWLEEGSGEWEWSILGELEKEMERVYGVGWDGRKVGWCVGWVWGLMDGMGGGGGWKK